MATYVIGDLQGCFLPLKALLKTIRFNEKKDTLWFTGDLVNRGPHSLETLRFVKHLCEKKCAITILGNHDLMLLAIAKTALVASHNCDAIFHAPDSTHLLNWLLKQPLLYYDTTLDYTLVHAGILPLWDLKTAQKLANEAENVLQGVHSQSFFEQMYGDHPDCWNNDLSGFNRIRFIINSFTRLRFCSNKGQLEFATKTQAKHAPKGFSPWFELYEQRFPNARIVFGHWAALNNIQYNQQFALDTGCVWGNKLTALRLNDKKIFQVPGISHPSK
jgi:bis(5'-nucleosyl)-tetraphosphatase (symmetrical)